jgi:uncharacterized protein (TIGR03437 family)
MSGVNVRWAVLLLSGASLAPAAPILRLSQTVATVQASVLQAYNAGDGALSPGVSVPAGVSWVTASVGGACPAGSPQSCVLIQFNFNTASLANGTYAANVTVFAPGAVDSPQTVIAIAEVTGQPDGGVTDVDAYLNPGATCDLHFTPACDPFSYGGNSLSVNTQDGGPWLSIVTAGATTLACAISYQIHLAPPASMAAGAYSGSVASAASGRSSSTIPVLMHLVDQPLATPVPGEIDLTVAQRGPPVAYPFLPAIALSPAGTVGATSAVASGAGISASVSGGLVLVKVDPASLVPGAYNGSVTIGCNPANCPVVVPVNLTIVGPGPPVIDPGVFDNVTATWGAVAPGEVLVVQGEQLSGAEPAFANGLPLPTTLGGTSVLVNGIAAPLYYASSNQIAFQLPGNTPTTQTSLVQVERDGQTSSGLQLAAVAPRAPQIAAITDAAYNLLDADHPAHVGDVIILWAIGLGATNPAVPDGAAAPSGQLAIAGETPTVQFGSSVIAFPSFAGLSPGAVGLYQVNVTIPASTPGGNLFVKMVYPGATSNAAPIAVQ